MWIRVKNTSKHPVAMRAVDGDSVLVQPMSIATVDGKFNWMIPKPIRVLDMDESLKEAPPAPPAPSVSTPPAKASDPKN